MSAARRNAGKSARRQSYYDTSLLILIMFIVAFGLVMIYSASSYIAQIKEAYNYDAAYFLKKQMLSVLIGMIGMIVVSMIDYRVLVKPLPIIGMPLVVFVFAISIIFQTLVLFVGREVNGAKRWLGVGSASFQPSEITKIAIILFLSYIILKKTSEVSKISGIVRIVLYMIVPVALVAKENLSAGIIILAIIFGICFVASKNKLPYIIFAIMIAGILALIVFKGGGFRAERFEIWRNVETHEKGEQILQGMYAIASGGMFGKGLGHSMQKMGFLAEGYNDFIFAIICEELGLVGATMVLMLFVLLIWRIYQVAVAAPDLYGGLICSGVMIQIAIQVILNVLVVTNSIPSTGVSLPFISYGGTSVSILLAEMGLVLSVSNRIETR